MRTWDSFGEFLNLPEEATIQEVFNWLVIQAIEQIVKDHDQLADCIVDLYRLGIPSSIGPLPVVPLPKPLYTPTPEEVLLPDELTPPSINDLPPMHSSTREPTPWCDRCGAVMDYKGRLLVKLAKETGEVYVLMHYSLCKDCGYEEYLPENRTIKF